MRILLVDPQSEAVTVIARWLDEFFAHVEIEAAASAGAALAALQKRTPDLLITAHAPPSLDGIELEPAASTCGSRKRHLQASLLDFLQRRFGETWAKSVAERKMACAR